MLKRKVKGFTLIEMLIVLELLVFSYYYLCQISSKQKQKIQEDGNAAVVKSC